LPHTAQVAIAVSAAQRLMDEHLTSAVLVIAAELAAASHRSLHGRRRRYASDTIAQRFDLEAQWEGFQLCHDLSAPKTRFLRDSEREPTIKGIQATSIKLDLRTAISYGMYCAGCHHPQDLRKYGTKEDSVGRRGQIGSATVAGLEDRCR
jgi:hypothetical protein